MTGFVYIYVLCDPETGEVRYLGKTKTPETRLAQHLSDARHNHRVAWIQSLARRRLTPALRVWDMVPDHNWQNWERFYIQSLRQTGARLVNGTAGGDGVVATPEVRAKMSAAKLGRTFCHSTETKLKIGNANRGKTRSLEFRNKISDANRGRIVSRKTRDKMQSSQLSRWKRQKEVCPTN